MPSFLPGEHVINLDDRDILAQTVSYPPPSIAVAEERLRTNWYLWAHHRIEPIDDEV